MRKKRIWKVKKNKIKKIVKTMIEFQRKMLRSLSNMNIYMCIYFRMESSKPKGSGSLYNRSLGGCGYCKYKLVCQGQGLKLRS